MVHLDLHPLNVMGTSAGLVVIDWANARRGDPAVDVANTWSLLACGEPPGGVLDRVVTALGRGLMLRAFLGATDRAAAKRVMPALIEWRLQDRNHTDAERRRLARLAD
jgi:aminoglycoside phosphotransferase (APT) family kinase protein